MKKYIFLFFAIVASGLLSSCTDTLNLQNDGRIDLSAVFTDRYKTMGYLNSCYNYRPHPYTDKSGLCDEGEEVGDNISGSKFSVWYQGSLNASNFAGYQYDSCPWYGIGNSWDYFYQGIRKCNVFLANVWQAQIEATSEEKAGWAAQAHALRALYYLQLIKRYGSVPLYDKPIEVNHDFTKDTKAKFSSVVKLILADCDSALAAPATQNGFPWEIYNNQSEIMSRAVPYAIKSEAITYAASPLWTDGTYSWTDATKINADALYQCLTHDYSLYNITPDPSYAQNAYTAYFISNFDNDYQRTKDKETIYQAGMRVSGWYYNGLPTTSSMASAGVCPSQQLVDSYEMQATGLPITDPNSGYDSQNPYDGRDPRFYGTIYYNGSPRHLPLNCTAAMKFTAKDPFYGVQAKCPSWSNNIGNLTMTLYKWTGTYAGSVSGTPVAQQVYINYNDNAELSVTTSSPWAAGDYVWVLSDPSETVGVWKWVDGTATKEENPVSYFNGTVTSGNYRSDIAYAPDTYTSFVNGAANQTPVNIYVTSLVQTYVGGAEGISQTDQRYTRTGYYLRKYNNHQSGLNNESDGAVRLFRLAELYMNFAESAYESTGDPYQKVSLGSGMSMSAWDAVNAIRERAGMPDLPAGLGKSAFEARYRNERRVEFAFEEHRFFDVRRWKILDQTDQYVSGMRITKNGSNYTYTPFNFNNRNSSSTKWYLFPLDQSEVNKMVGYTGVSWQNPGW